MILSGTAPKDIPDMKNYYTLNKCGAVSVVINSKGLRVKRFIEEVEPADTDDEE